MKWILIIDIKQGKLKKKIPEQTSSQVLEQELKEEQEGFILMTFE